MAERVQTGYNLHDGQRDTSREVLQSVADAIRRAATHHGTALVFDYGLPATTLPDAIGRLEELQKLTLIHTSRCQTAWGSCASSAIYRSLVHRA
ncbi:hypothetical protein XEUV181_21015 [Xanthomonas euvesicatoria]|nr:hypothetical protein BHE83_16990 [Xanthomonas euvesicatoria pv. vesicatoria str. 85-10]APO92135.1 hypothetical protein BJD11_20820 [Xanthomonas euvesicatoria]KHL66564.1 hypothetical protein XEU83M_05975 [Xanthomonas euvesicatoria]KLA86877.1 hypothetical protein XEUV181_21015 [Xanthomonas euvesicatoria]KLB32015.1 hypothetical protein XEUV199_19995 [Xanthomonas euvesicatoria]